MSHLRVELFSDMVKKGFFLPAKLSVVFVLGFAFAAGAAAQSEWFTPDPSIVSKFHEEEAQHSHVMEVLGYLTDVYGPRLTNSPNIREAADYAVKTLTSYGLSNVHEETWGPFGRGWSNELFEANEIAPRDFSLIAYSKAWTPGTNGVVTADAIFAKIEKEEDFAFYRGKLRGLFVLTAPMRAVEPLFDPLAHRLTDQELAGMVQARAPQPPDKAARDRQRKLLEFNAKLIKFLTDEGAAAWLEPTAHDGGTVTVMAGGSRDPKDPLVLPRIAVDIENYGRIFRTLEKNIPVKLRINIVNKFYDDNLDSFNIVAEIPGTDKVDEVVMLGAHFDSWAGGDGATDNAAGSAVMMEAMRILKASNLKMRRTVRLALWTGEEEGLLGSRAYVKEHFADRASMTLKPDHAKLSGYFNVDNGTGKIRGIYLQDNEALRPIFEKWMEPFKPEGMTTLSSNGTNGTDHVSFDEVGLPGFQFIQDPIEYETRTHHTNMDVYERLQPADLKQMAVIVASFVYMTANADQPLPRKILPKQ
ncbi:MAG TPA: M20/M25/M40 family metallo-hydrolase [Candidatus Acidoferrales bacterium]|nr:M20/M25/M40 family metallo-hydrolase [Candidatus Acidoferrales bacterium]